MNRLIFANSDIAKEPSADTLLSPELLAGWPRVTASPGTNVKTPRRDGESNGKEEDEEAEAKRNRVSPRYALK